MQVLSHTLNASAGDLKAGVDFRTLVSLSHEVQPNGKLSCPFHADGQPSCHIYPDGYKCFGCGAYGDHVDWLKKVHHLSLKEAFTCLRSLVGKPYVARAVRHKPKPEFTPVDTEQLMVYQHYRDTTSHVPKALVHHGFSLRDLQLLGVAAVGEDALLPVRGPRGDILALKRRFARARAGQRYVYATAGHGSPAWCSPGLGRAAELLLIEGELNGMMAHLALREAGVDLGVMAVAGAQGRLHLAALRGKRVYLYADGDVAGTAAKARWQRVAERAGSGRVRALPAFQQDACETVRDSGKPYLAACLLESMHSRSKRSEALNLAA